MTDFERATLIKRSACISILPTRTGAVLRRNGQIQGRDRTQKSLPLFPGRLQTLANDYKWNGTTSLFATISVFDGLVIS